MSSFNVLKEKARTASKMATMIVGKTFASTLLVVGVFCMYVAVDAAILTALWAAVVPDLFPRAVSDGYLTKQVDFRIMFLACLALVVLRPVNMSSIFKKEK